MSFRRVIGITYLVSEALAGLTTLGTIVALAPDVS